MGARQGGAPRIVGISILLTDEIQGRAQTKRGGGKTEFRWEGWALWLD